MRRLGRFLGILPLMRSEYGAMSPSYLRALRTLDASYTQSGQLQKAEMPLEEAGRIVDAKFPPGSPEWLTHQDDVAVLRTFQGRLHEGLAAMRAGMPYLEASAKDHNVVDVMGFRINERVLRLMAGEYDGLEDTANASLPQADRLYRPANDQSDQVLHNLATYYLYTGQTGKALAIRQDLLRRVEGSPVQNPSRLFVSKALVQLMRARAFEGDKSAIGREARSLLAQVDARREAPTPLPGRKDFWQRIANVGLVFDDRPLVEDAMAHIHADTAGQSPGSLAIELDGELARLQNDLPRSRQLLTERLRFYDAYPDKALAPIWSATLDLAYTQVLMGDPAAAETLRLAAARRPPKTPPGTPLDAVSSYLAARLQTGSDDAPAAKTALAALAKAQHRAVDDPRAGRLSLGGVFF